MSKKVLTDFAGYAKFELNEDSNGKWILTGEFGKADQPTANGRVYPKSLWEREIKKIKPSMAEGKVFSHLNHPCLLDDDFRVLTLEGWKNFRDVKIGDKVWSRVNGEAIPSIVEKIIDEPYKGHAYKFNMNHIQSGFTPQHKIMLLDYNYEKELFVTAEDLFNDLNKYSHNPIPKKAKFFSENPNTFTIKGTTDNCIAKCNTDVSKDLILDSKIFSAFIGIYLSEGSCSSFDSDNYAIHIYQKNEWSKKYIYDEILSKFPNELKWIETKNGFYLADARIYNYLIKLGDAYTKYIPREVKKLGRECLRELLFWFSIGDGRITATGKNRKSEFSKDESTVKQRICEEIRYRNIKYVNTDVFSVSKKLISDLHECLVLSGGAGSLQTIVTENDYFFAGRMIKAKNKVPLYQLHISTGEYLWIKPDMDIEKINHDGNIFCLQTKHGNFYMEQYGKSFWTGNSDGKTDLKEVAMVMKDLWMEADGTIYGKAELCNNQWGDQYKAIHKAGGKVGVSSRGMGSTKMGEGKYSGHEVVDDDYEYMTHDLVADPAVRTSYPKVTIDSNKEQFKAEDTSVAKEPIMELKYTEEDLQKKLNEQKDLFAKELVEKTSSLKESLEKEMKEKSLADAAGEINKEAEKAQEAAEKQDEKDLKAKEKKTEEVKVESEEMKQMKSQLEAKDKEIESLKSGIKEITEGAKRLGMALVYEKQLGLAGEDRSEIIEDIGDVKKYKSVDELTEAVKKSKKKIADKKKAKLAEKKKMEDIEAKFAEQKQKLEEETKKAKAEADEVRKKLAESLKKEAALQAKVYLEHVLRGHPHAQEIRNLCEGVIEKDKIDKIVQEKSIDAATSKEYNLVQNRIARLEAIEKSKEKTQLVESQLEKEKPTDKVVVDVDAEIAEAIN